MRALLFVLGLGTLCGGVAAAPPPAGSEAAGGGRMAAFRFDANISFTLLCRPGAPTDIQLAPEEKVVGFALGDSVQWVVEELPGHVFVKPLHPGQSTAGTLVTDRRTYQLALRSVTGDAAWHQRVSWSYPDLVLLRDAARAGHEATRDSADPDRLASARLVDPAVLNFAYDIAGDADIRPLQAFDDGRVTWLRMRAGKPLPAVFVIGTDGTELVNYTMHGDHIVIQRVFASALLKLGKSEARVANAAAGRAPVDIGRGGAGARRD